MTFLPIVQRELRVASQRKSTFVIRCLVALLALLLSGIGLLIGAIISRSGVGTYAFTFLSYYTFLIAMLGGIVLASDSLSQERREGTLGFLFLTDLKGYDVVLGKFIAISLNAFYGLLAVFPILGLSLLAGGVTGGEFWRVALALVNALFFSVTSALWISSRSVASYRSMIASICLLIGLFTIAEVIRGCLKLVPSHYTGLLYGISAFNPAEPFVLASDAGYMFRAADYWRSLGISNLLGWIFLGVAAWGLSRRIEPVEATSFWRRFLTGQFLAGKSKRRPALLEINPILWLLDENRWTRWLAWGLAVAGAILVLTFSSTGMMAGMLNSYIAMPFYFILKIFFAVQACRFFSEARRTGSLELVCVTPLTPREIVDAQWQSLRQNFFWPVVTLITAQIWAMTLTSLVSRTSAGFAFLPIGFTVGWQVVKTIADFFALGWFGMWLAFSSRKPDMAAGLTILIVLIGPSLAFCIPTAAIDVVFMVFARSKLLRDFQIPSSVLGDTVGLRRRMI